MIIGIEFDGVIVAIDHAFDDFSTPLRFIANARATLRALKRAGHVLVLCSSRANPSRRSDPLLNPLIRTGATRVDAQTWEAEKSIHEARYQQMLAFVNTNLAGVFDAIDDGYGRPELDLYIASNVVRFGHGVTSFDWRKIGETYGELEGEPVDG